MIGVIKIFLNPWTNKGHCAFFAVKRRFLSQLELNFFGL